MSEQPLDQLLEDPDAGYADPSDEPDVITNLAVFPDEAPSSGEWVDIDDVLAEPTEEELELGRILGEGIDVDDDDDTGLDDEEAE